MKKGILRNFAKFTGKHLCQSLFFNKVAGTCNFIKKETLAQVFSCEFCEISKNTFFTDTSGRLILKTLLKFTGKHLCNSLFFNNFIKKETPTLVFFSKFYKIFKNSFFTEHLRTSAYGKVESLFELDLNAQNKTSVSIFFFNKVSLLKTVLRHR